MMNIVFKNDEYCHKGGCHYYDNITQSSLAAAVIQRTVHSTMYAYIFTHTDVPVRASPSAPSRHRIARREP